MENQVTQLLKAMVKPDYTACSYAFMQNGKIVCAMRLVLSTKSIINPSQRIVHLMYVPFLKFIAPYVSCS